jgi:hypothetical protein
MRPRLITARNILLFLVAASVFGGLAYWVQKGMPLPGYEVPSTAGKLVFVSDRGGNPDLWMMNADGSGAATALTNDAATDRAPAWASDGKLLAFISENRVGVNPQVFEVAPVPGSKVAQVTRTDSAKDSPVFGSDGRIYFLDAGKVVSVDRNATDSEALLPHPEHRQRYASVFGAGGFQRMLPMPGSPERLGAVMRVEGADALMAYEGHGEESAVLNLVGIADSIRFDFLADGGMAALFEGAEPFPQPRPVIDTVLESDQTRMNPQVMMVLEQTRALIAAPDEAPPEIRPARRAGLRALAVFDRDARLAGGMVLGDISPDDLRASPVGNVLALTSESGEGKRTGVFLVTLSEGQPALRQLFDRPAREVTWSPDGAQLAWVSGGDIFVGAVDGSAPPRNLTQGKGQNYAPAWSPAKPKK